MAVTPSAAGRARPPRIMLAGHCDQIGLMVQHIDETAFLHPAHRRLGHANPARPKLDRVDAQGGSRVVARRAPHLMTDEERNKVPPFTDVWIDIGARIARRPRNWSTPGDPVTFALGYRPLRNRLAASPGMDDKVGLWTVMEALRLMQGRPLQAAVFCVSTVQEEIGLRGATTSSHGIHPPVGIAVDVCHATDTPSNDKKQLGDVRLGNGPTLFRGAEHQPARLRPARGNGASNRESRSRSRRPAGHRHGCQRDAACARGRGDRGCEHPQPLHAQSGRGGPSRRP